MIKKLIIIFPVFMIFLNISAAESMYTDLTVLYTNDIHSQLRPLTLNWKGENVRLGGFSEISGIADSIRNARKNVLLLSAGDVMTGPPVSRLTKGEAVFDLMNLMHYDAMCLGNHEFDQGWKNVINRINQANFPVLAANIFYKNTNIPFAMPCTVFEKGPLKIGIIGILGRKAALETINTRLVEPLEFRDQISTLHHWVPILRPYVDVLIVLAHEGVAGMQSTTAETDKQRRLDTDIEVAKQVKGIDVLITGHAHRGIEVPIIIEPHNTLLVSTYGMGTRLGELILTIDMSTRTLIKHQGQLIPVLADSNIENQTVESCIKKWEETVNTITEEVIGTTNFSLTRDYYSDSPLGNLCADAFREAGGSDIAITNSGGLRADIEKGNITVGQVLSAYPFENPIVTVNLTGEQITKILEHGATLEYGICQISGINIVIDRNQPKGKRLVSASINGNPINTTEMYTVSTSDYLANGGDAYTVFLESDSVKFTGRFCTEAIIDFIRKKQHIRKSKTKRIQLIDNQVQSLD